MIGFTEALLIAAEYLKAHYPQQYRVVICAVEEYEFGWLFGYQTEEYVLIGNTQHVLVGNTPLIVERATGRLLQTVDSLLTAEGRNGGPFTSVVHGCPDLEPSDTLQVTNRGAGPVDWQWLAEIILTYTRCTLDEATSLAESCKAGRMIEITPDGELEFLAAVTDLMRNGLEVERKFVEFDKAKGYTINGAV